MNQLIKAILSISAKANVQKLFSPFAAGWPHHLLRPKDGPDAQQS